MSSQDLSSLVNPTIQVNVELNFNGEEFNEENIRLAVMVVERLVEQVGIDELNTTVDRHYTVLSSRRERCSRQNVTRVNREYTTEENLYGRYTVTGKSIQIMEPLCEEANMIIEPIDRFYKEKFEALGTGFDKASTTIHAISSFLGLWGIGTWNLSKLFSATDSNSTIFEKIQVGGVALASQTTAGKIINGGAQMLKVLDWVMPHMKTSKTLVKLSEKVWDLTRKDIQMPWMQRRIEQYIREHYELKYGMKNFSSLEFILFHDVIKTLDEAKYRRIYESACFAAEYIIFSRDINERIDVRCGIYLNLVRSGMCNRENIDAIIANDIVDKLYNQYVNNWRVVPNVEVNPYRGR